MLLEGRLNALWAAVRPRGQAYSIQRCQACRPQLIRCQQSAKKELSVASRVVQDYSRLQKPAVHNISFSKALKAFTCTAVLAFECGYTELLLRDEVEASCLHASLSVPEPSQLKQEEVDNCILSLALVWITLSMLPSSARKRWASVGAVSDDTLKRWSGFVGVIVKGYLERRWAAYPIDRLQAEIALMTGRLERPSVVAEWSRIVYAALDQAAPQWP